MNENEERYFEPYKIPKVRASVAAGDAFTGILGAFLASGAELFEAIENAIIGSAISVTRYGAQESMPFYDEIMTKKS